MKSLWLDLSFSCSAWGIIDTDPSSVPVQYGRIFPSTEWKEWQTGWASDRVPKNEFGFCGYRLMKYILDLLIEKRPDAIGIEDIFMQGGEFKDLAKLQGVAEMACFLYNPEIVPVFKLASSIRAPHKLNIKRILEQAEYEKKAAERAKVATAAGKKYKAIPYELYAQKENYRNHFPEIDFDEYKNWRIYKDKIFHATNDILNLTITGKKGKIRTVGSQVKEFPYAQKIVVITKVNKLLGTSFTYADNDVCDALLGAYNLSNDIISEEEPDAAI